MTPHVRWLTTEEQRERFYLARRVGGMCAACGRALSPDEPVYVEPFTIGPADDHMTAAHGPVGAECAAPERVREAAGEEPERCAGCDRPMFYRRASTRRRRALCSHRCSGRAVARRRRGEA